MDRDADYFTGFEHPVRIIPAQHRHKRPATQSARRGIKQKIDLQAVVRRKKPLILCKLPLVSESNCHVRTGITPIGMNEVPSEVMLCEHR